MRTPHERLFADYVQELRQAKEEVEIWWRELIEAETRRVEDRQQARVQCKRRWPLGAAAHPRIVHVLRKYYLLCVALNDELTDADGEGDEVYPHQFVSEWLLDEDTEDLGDFISGLSYWPIGLDEDGDPC
jgi:hypothetical protein